MSDEDKYYGYTPVLSKRFPDFAGLCTIRDFWIQSFRLFGWSILYFAGGVLLLSVFSVLLEAFSNRAAAANVHGAIVLAIVVLLSFMYYMHVFKPYAIALAQRLHTHGKSCTRWVLIPNLIYIVICIIIVIQ